MQSILNNDDNYKALQSSPLQQSPAVEAFFQLEESLCRFLSKEQGGAVASVESRNIGFVVGSKQNSIGHPVFMLRKKCENCFDHRSGPYNNEHRSITPHNS